ncbi:senescence regulator (Protein of unknown function, DUF584) [Thalictrum thalictroides]|uniref:Senescence regulator S40 n=1 Tax=Thalictrum thalictroides TaxID=46969 RepID=A0A7J6WNI9_THATH|nr:senescence regulator (Protein of unknown function, DUF584) [Thalictrum thalictroides]
METNGVTSFRHRNNSPSSERFLGLFSQSQSNADKNPNADKVFVGDDELDENDVFWTGNFSQSDHQSDSPTTNSGQNHNSNSFRHVDSSGILAALRIDDEKSFLGDNRLLKRKISLPSSTSASSRMIPTIPKPQASYDREYFSSLPSGINFRHSAPVNVPMRPKRETVESELSDDESDKEMLPPHEMVARGSSQSDTTFSVLEGVGRTLKGRDLRQVRNAVWRQTGFVFHLNKKSSASH